MIDVTRKGKKNELHKVLFINARMTTQMVNECTTNILSKKKLNVMEMKNNYGRDMKIANYCKSPKQVETKGLISYFQSRHEAIVLNVCAIFCSNEEKGMVRNIFHWV